MTVIELKAQAYDFLVQIERYQDLLRKVNQQIAIEINKPKESNDLSGDGTA